MRPLRLKRFVRFSLADGLLAVAFSIVMCAEVAFLKPVRRLPPSAAEAVDPVAIEDVASFDTAFGPAAARLPSRQQIDFARAGCRTPAGNEYFFPRGSFREDSPPPWHQPMDSHMRAGFSGTLRNLGEPSLSCRAERAQGFRFFWVRASGNVAIVVRLPTDPALAASVRVTGAPPRVLSVADQREFVALFERTNFWSMPTFRDAVGLDGASWLIEARVGEHYHVVDRWSPRQGAFRDLGLCFMRVARLPTDASSLE